MTRRLAFALCLLLLIACACGEDGGSKATRIAIIGAGPAGLTAAYTLRSLGYKHFLVYEKEPKAGGRVYTNTDLGTPVELGTVFTTNAATLTLGYAEQYGVPYVERPLSTSILDDDGTVLSREAFAARKYGVAAVSAAMEAYLDTLVTYHPDQITRLADLPPELKLPFSQFAQLRGFMPLADAYRGTAAALGYPYYEDVPAVYDLKLMAGFIPGVNPDGTVIESTIYAFPGGFQELYTKLAADLGSQDDDGDGVVDWGVIYNAEVTKVRRWNTGSGPKVEITANGQDRVFDRVIIATPPNATVKYLDMTADEAELFGQVESRNYHVNVLRVDGVPAEKSALLLYPNTRAANIGHLNMWVRGGPSPFPYFASYQNVAWSQSTELARQLLVQDFAVYGEGTVGEVLLHRDWYNFPHFGTEALQNGASDRLEDMQGENGTFFVGGVMNLDSVEGVSRYARDLVNANF